MVLWKKKKKIEVCLNPDFYLMRSHMIVIQDVLCYTSLQFLKKLNVRA